jgi:hypothetical protein
MSLPQEFFDFLDEAPCTANGVLVRTARGETRNVPRSVFAQEFRRKARAAPRFPRRERARNLNAILSYQLEKEEREQ